MRAEVLHGEALRALEPALSKQVSGGIYFKTERHLDPVTLMAALRSRCVQLGVTIIEDAPVETVEMRGNRVTAVRTPEMRVECDAVVLAAGAWSGALAAAFGLPLPVRAGKGYAIDCVPPPVQLRTMTNLSDAKVAVTPLDSRLRLAGTMEFGSHDEKVNEVRVAAILRAPSAYFSEWPTDPPHVVAGAGMRPMTPDGLPILGAIPGLTNAFVSTGHGMMGVTLAAGTARVMGDLIVDGRLSPALIPFSSSRFRARRAA
jgi:D-amino-acid dehydrogenase